MDGTRASDEVIDEIALIAMLRQDSERHGSGASAGSEALRKLHELRDREQKAMQEAADKTVHQANLEAVANEIRKVQHLSGNANRGGGGGDRHARPRPQQQQPRKEGGGGGGGNGGGGGQRHNQSRNNNQRRNQGRPGGQGRQGGQGQP
jgi:hypothetical protein